MRGFSPIYSAFTGEFTETWISPCENFFIDHFVVENGIYTGKYRIHPRTHAIIEVKDISIIHLKFDTAEEAMDFYFNNPEKFELHESK